MTLQELGQAIRTKRTAAALSIDDVAGRIKVSSRILKSIEDGSLDGLPHAVYTKSFIRTFGLLVGYDAAELAKHLDELFPPESLDETRNEPGPRTRTLQVSSGSGRNIAILLFFVVMLTVLAVGGWYVAKNYGDMILNLVKTPFSAITAPPLDSDQAERRRADSRFVMPTTSANGSAPSLRTAPVPATSPSAARLAGTEEEASSPDDRAQIEPEPASPAPPSAAPALAGVAASGLVNATAQTVQDRADEKNRLLIVADQPCWVSFRIDGVKGRDHILRPEENLALPYKSSLEIILGNAGGVSMTHNGRDMGRPGRSGQRVAMSFPRSGE